MGKARIIVLYISAAFLIIGIHQSITQGFEYSYWIFMITLSLYFLSRLLDQKDGKGKTKKEPKKSKVQKGNRQSKRYMRRAK